MLQCDFSYMISPNMFKRFVVPDLTACCDHLDYGFYHLDGKGELPQSGSFALHQTVARSAVAARRRPAAGRPLAAGAAGAHPQRGQAVQVYVTRQGAFTVKKELGGKGFLFHIINDPMTVEEGRAFVRALNE